MSGPTTRYEHPEADLLELLLRATAAANRATDTRQATEAVLGIVCGFTGWPIGHAFVVESGPPARLVSAGLWHVEGSEEFTDFRQLTEAMSFEKGMGLPGCVWASGEPAWIADLIEDPNCPRAKGCSSLSDGAGFALPVVVGDEVVAVLEFVSRTAVDVDERLLRVLKSIGIELGHVTERQQAGQALGASESRYSDLYNNTPALMHSVDRDGRIIGVSDYWLQVMGYAREEVLGRDITEFQTESSRTIALKAVRPIVFEKGSISDVPLQFVKKDGEILEGLLSVTTERDSHGNIVRALGVITDVTTIKEAERALRDNEERLGAILDTTADGIITIDARGRIETFNQAAQTIFGYSAEEVRGRNVSMLMDEPYRGEHDQYIKNFQRTGEAKIIGRGREVTARRKDGTNFPLYLAISEFQAGGVPHFTGIIRDLSEQKRVEELLATAIESMPEGFALYDAEDKLVLCNRKMPEFYPLIADVFVPGVTFEEVLRAGVERGQFPEARGREEEWIADRLGRHRTPTGPVEYNLPDGRVVRVEEWTTRDGGTVGIRTDITDMRRAGEALRESEMRLRAIMDNASVLITLKDVDHRFTMVNKAFEEYFGIVESDVVGKTVREIWNAEDAEAFEALERTVLETGEAVQAEIRPVDDRATAMFLSIKFPIRNADGEIVSVGTINMDISDLKRAENAFRESEKLLRTILEASPVGVFVVTRDGEHLFANQRALEMQGVTREELDASNAGDYYEDSDVRAKLKDALYETGFMPETELTLIKKNGERFHVMMSSVLTEFEGRSAHLTYMYDITERRQAEEAIRESERLLKGVIDAVPALINIKDLDSRYLMVNRYQEEFFGVEKGTYVGKSSREMISPEHGERVREVERRVIDTGEVAEFFLNALTNEKGEKRTVLVTKAPLKDQSDAVSGVVTASIDVTDLKEAQEQMRMAKEEAERANRAKSEFLSSMSHELRTPMNAILGFSQLLKNNPKEPLSEKQDEYTGHVLDSGQHLLELIDQVLELAQIEAGKALVTMEDVEPGKIIVESLTLVAPRAAERKIKIIDRSTLPDMPPIRTDATRFKQMLLNLLSNAVKYNRQGGTITVTAERKSGGMLRISIADTGMGIAKDKQCQVFQPFNRLGVEDGEIEGTGIGLTITKEIVELLSGRIGFKSVEGKGSTFWIELPMAEESSASRVEEADNERAVEGPGFGSSTVHRLVLYIDDSRVNVRLMEEIIGRLPNVSMLSAPSAERGLELAAEHRPDIILMDINLPGMDGYEALQALRASEPTQTTPVVALTASAMPKDVEKGLQAGFHDYITKPFDIPKIRVVIEEALESVTPTEVNLNSAPVGARIH